MVVPVLGNPIAQSWAARAESLRKVLSVACAMLDIWYIYSFSFQT